jgi:hypothetical protein
MLEAHTPPWYKDLLERYGMQKDHDLYAWRVTFDRVGAELLGAPSDISRVADAARKDGALSIRHIRLADWDREVSIIRGLFNATLSHIPGAVPAGEDFNRDARQLRPFLDAELGLIAGIDALLYVTALAKAKERGYAWLDGSLTSELNPAINLIAKGRGAEMYKHYRLYRMPV